MDKQLTEPVNGAFVGIQWPLVIIWKSASDIYKLKNVI